MAPSLVGGHSVITEGEPACDVRWCRRSSSVDRRLRFRSHALAEHELAVRGQERADTESRQTAEVVVAAVVAQHLDSDVRTGGRLADGARPDPRVILDGLRREGSAGRPADLAARRDARVYGAPSAASAGTSRAQLDRACSGVAWTATRRTRRGRATAGVLPADGRGCGAAARRRGRVPHDPATRTVEERLQRQQWSMLAIFRAAHRRYWGCVRGRCGRTGRPGTILDGLVTCWALYGARAVPGGRATGAPRPSCRGPCRVQIRERHLGDGAGDLAAPEAADHPAGRRLARRLGGPARRPSVRVPAPRPGPGWPGARRPAVQVARGGRRRASSSPSKLMTTPAPAGPRAQYGRESSCCCSALMLPRTR